MGDCWLPPSIQRCTQVRFGCLSPQQDTFMDTLNINNWSRTFFLYFTKVFPPADAGLGVCRIHGRALPPHRGQPAPVCDWEAQIEDFRSLLLSFLWSLFPQKCGWEGDKTFFPLCQSLNYLLVAKSTKFTPTPPWMPKAPSVLYSPKPTTCYKSNSALHHSGSWSMR